MLRRFFQKEVNCMITENIATIREKIKKAAIAAGRDPQEILLCAATKMNDAAAVREAICAGVDCCGENRVQELTAKLADNEIVVVDGLKATEYKTRPMGLLKSPVIRIYK